MAMRQPGELHRAIDIQEQFENWAQQQPWITSPAAVMRLGPIIEIYRELNHLEDAEENLRIYNQTVINSRYRSSLSSYVAFVMESRLLFSLKRFNELESVVEKFTPIYQQGISASMINSVIDDGQTYNDYIVESVDFTGTVPGIYTFHVSDPQAGTVELRIDGETVYTLSYVWLHTVQADDRSTDYVFNFHDYLIIKVRKAGVGSMNLYNMNQSMFDGVQSITAVAGPQRVGRWRGYTYRWNDTETNADLIKDDEDLSGEDWDDNWAVVDRAVTGNLFGNEVWRYPGGGNCYECHGGYQGMIKEPVDTPTAFDSFVPGYETLDNAGMTYSDFAKVASIGPETAQMNLTCENDQGLQANQFDTLVAMGMFMESTLPASWEPALKLIDPKHDLLEPLEDRARSYVHANCSHCHRKQPDGFGPGTEDFRFHLNNGLGASGHPNISWPADFFDIWRMGCEENKLLIPGKPERSILSLRVNFSGLAGFPFYGSPLKMPYTGVIVKDQLGIALIDAWIKSGLGLFDPLLHPEDHNAVDFKGIEFCPYG